MGRGTPRRVPGSDAVPGAGRITVWLLRLAEAAARRSGRPTQGTDRRDPVDGHPGGGPLWQPAGSCGVDAGGVGCGVNTVANVTASVTDNFLRVPASRGITGVRPTSDHDACLSDSGAAPSRRSGRDGSGPAAALLGSRVVVGKPRVDGSGVPLRCPPDRLLGRVVPLRQPLAEVAQVAGHAEPVPDEVAAGSAHLGGQTTLRSAGTLLDGQPPAVRHPGPGSCWYRLHIPVGYNLPRRTTWTTCESVGRNCRGE